MELNLKDMIVNLLTNSETTVNKLYEFVNGSGSKPNRKEFETFRKDLINSVKKKKENALELFPIIKYFESKRLTEEDLQNDETLFTIPSEERIAIASPIEILQEVPEKQDYNMHFMWDNIDIEERESLVYKAFNNYYEIIKDDENIRKAIQSWGTFVEKNLFITQTERDLFLEDIPQEVFSLHQSDNLSGLLPTEIAQLDDPDLELVFYKNFVEKKLLSYQLWGIEREIVEEIDIFEKDIKDRGPLVLCVDTSGSMRGLKEIFSKAIAMVIVNILEELKVNVILLTFSTKARSIDLSDSKNKLKSTRDTFKKSFYGGSDISVAIDEIYKVLGNKKHRKANILIISDFLFKNPSRETLQKINKLKEREHHFHSLKINNKDNKSTLETMFTTNWAYKYNFNGLNLEEDEEEMINEIAEANVASKNNLETIKAFGFIKKIKDWDFVAKTDEELKQEGQNADQLADNPAPLDI